MAAPVNRIARNESAFLPQVRNASKTHPKQNFFPVDGKNARQRTFLPFAYHFLDLTKTHFQIRLRSWMLFFLEDLGEKWRFRHSWEASQWLLFSPKSQKYRLHTQEPSSEATDDEGWSRAAKEELVTREERREKRSRKNFSLKSHLNPSLFCWLLLFSLKQIFFSCTLHLARDHLHTRHVQIFMQTAPY